MQNIALQKVSHFPNARIMKNMVKISNQVANQRIKVLVKSYQKWDGPACLVLVKKYRKVTSVMAVLSIQSFHLYQCISLLERVC